MPPRPTQSFATFLILCPTSFFLGTLFSLFPYDFPLLWTSLPPPPAYLSQLETHLRHLHAAPAVVPRILHIVIAVGLLGFVLKLYRPSESNLLFDGASLVLYVCGIVVYLTNIVQGLRGVTAGEYGEVGGGGGGREEGLKVLAASNTILALVLVGVLVLQAGQWYAERKEGQEVEMLERERAAAGRGGGNGGAQRGGGGGGAKKRQ